MHTHMYSSACVRVMLMISSLELFEGIFSMYVDRV